MNGLLANLIKKQKLEIPRIANQAYVERSLRTRLVEGLDSDVIKVIIGPRRAGKSSLAFQVLKGRRFAYFNFEDEGISFSFAAEEILECFDEIFPEYQYILFDEIQLFPNWEHLVNRLQRLGKNLIITGSNSKLLSRELGSSLTGRYLEYQLFPFSYREYLEAAKGVSGIDSFLEYLRKGGFPAVATQRIPVNDFLVALWDAVILKDLVQRYKIRRIAELKSFLHLVLTSMGARVSFRSLEKALNKQLSHTTISKYLTWAEGAYLCCALQKFSFKARERVNSERKLYMYDNGFFSAQKPSASSDYGKLLENFVFIELCRSGLVPNLNLFSYQTANGHEVDFYTPPSSGKARLIQVSYSATSASTLDREIRALISASEELGVKDLYLITCDETEQVLEVSGCRIEILPAWSETFSRANVNSRYET
jgi:predicted AAA+ superfamily ATPase